jgi:hypothetical protein
MTQVRVLGNIARISLIRSLLAASARGFPILLTKVLYNDTHGGTGSPSAMLSG